MSHHPDSDHSHSLLEAIPLVGEGTGQTEAFSSYFVRLARHHRLPVKELYKYCFPERGRSRLHSRQISDTAMSFFNGYREDTLSAQNRMSELLHRDVSSMSLSAWRFCLDPMEKGVFAKNKKWCPSCLKEADVPHDRLLWFLKDYMVCSVHKVLLVDRCYHCGAHQPVMSYHNRIRLCHCCGSDLAKTTGVYIDHDYRSQCLESLVHLAVANPGLYEGFSYKEVLNRLIAQLGVGGFEPLEQLLGFGDRTLAQWANKRYQPSLSTFLDLMETLQIQPSSFISGHLSIDRSQIVPRRKQVRKHSENRKCKRFIERYLNKLLFIQKSEIPIRKIAHRIGVGVSFLNYNFPEHVRRIKLNNLCERTLKKIRRISALRKSIARAIRELEAAGCYPSHNKVMSIVRQQEAGSFSIGVFSRLWRMEISSESGHFKKLT